MAVRAGGVQLTWLLRTWRKDVAGLPQSTVVERLGISKGTLSMWEGGSRRPGIDQLRALDDCYGAGGALIDLALALGTPDGLPARHVWAHNPQGPSAPHWAWLRPAPGERWVEALLRWAAFGQEVAEPVGRGRGAGGGSRSDHPAGAADEPWPTGTTEAGGGARASRAGGASGPSGPSEWSGAIGAGGTTEAGGGAGPSGASGPSGATQAGGDAWAMGTGDAEASGPSAAAGAGGEGGAGADEDPTDPWQVHSPGVFVTTPVSMPNPAAWIRLARPGWVDFGRGVIPPELGIPIVPALVSAQVAGGGHSAAGLVAPHIVERFVSDPVFARAVLRFFGDRPDLVTQVFSTRQGWDRVARISPPVPDPAAAVPSPGPEHFRRLREARGLSLADAAQLATELMPVEPVGQDQVRGLEMGRNPRTRFVRSRLDTVYRADGHLCRDEVPLREGPATSADVRVDVELPEFWVGPVWFSLVPQGRARSGRVRLEWGADIKHMVFDGGATISCRRATRDADGVALFCPRGWRVTAGMGHRPDARDVNFGWLRKNDPGLEPTAHEDVNEIFLNWFGRTREDFRRFLAHPEAW